MGNQPWRGILSAAGVGAAMTGRGADLLIIDDPHSEQDALSSTAYDNTYSGILLVHDKDCSHWGNHHNCADKMV